MQWKRKAKKIDNKEAKKIYKDMTNTNGSYISTEWLPYMCTFSCQERFAGVQKNAKIFQEFGPRSKMHLTCPSDWPPKYYKKSRFAA